MAPDRNNIKRRVCRRFDSLRTAGMLLGAAEIKDKLRRVLGAQEPHAHAAHSSVPGGGSSWPARAGTVG